ncbi:MAG: HipA domain-containing protein [Coriobacteriales bacterium]|jgi:serine/threonine-protein kinase HipA|nr:HipA domain-containing protein [Coriobacteriales bacterium]
MTSSQECFVYLTLPGQTEPVTAGRFLIDTLSDGGKVGRFVYGRSYLLRADAVPIDPIELNLTNRTYETVRMQGMFGALRDASPDYWGRQLIERHIGSVALFEIDYLLNSPDDRIGALGFGHNPEPPAPKRLFNQMIDLERLQSIADDITNEREVVGSGLVQVEDLLLAGTSMGGARPKAVVSFEDALWIAKFNVTSDRWNSALIEHALLLLAQGCGLRVAQSKVVHVGDRDVLLVKRFDREKTESGYLRHRMISALTVLRVGDEVTDRSAWSYLALAEELRRFSAEPKRDARELFGRMVFDALVTNTDDHPRNHAFIAQDSWRLSPAYDLTPTPMIGIERRDLAMTCGRWGRFANAQNLISECHRFMLEPDEARSVIDCMSAYVKGNWYRAARSAGISERDCAQIQSAFAYPGFFDELSGQSPVDEPRFI